MGWVLGGGLILLLCAVPVIVGRWRYASLDAPWIGLLAGLGLIVGGIFLGRALANGLTEKRDTLSAEADGVLSSARRREELSRTLAIQVDMIAARCKLVDERFLAMTMAVMVDEFEMATTADDRQKSLMNAVTVLEKLSAKLTPWYVREEKLIALCVTIVGLIAGLVTIAQNIMKLMKKA